MTLQDGIVNALTAINKLQKLMVKMKSNWCHLFARSSPQCILQLLSLDQIELLNEYMRTRHANADDDEFLRIILSLKTAADSIFEPLFDLFPS